MPEMTITEAAQWTGKVRTTIFKAIKSGRISARRDDKGEYRIDPAELERVFKPAVVSVEIHTPGEQAAIGPELTALRSDNALLRAENALLREQLKKAEELQERLVTVLESHTRLLTDQRQKQRSKWQFWKRL